MELKCEPCDVVLLIIPEENYKDLNTNQIYGHLTCDVCKEKYHIVKGKLERKKYAQPWSGK